ncbi:uncharacterized protein LOC131883712 isoform X5 [Tigriopus californicus]|nr:uncharacterized protein LOC131883712 isoform X5 [Tigriopus californicus]
MKSTLSLSYKSWLALRNPQVLVLLAFAVLTIVSHSATAASIHESKRQKLIPFPRVGKRQGLIPFPRTGKRSLEMGPYSVNGFSSDFGGQAEDLLIPSILQRLANRKTMSSSHEDDSDLTASVAPHSTELYYNTDFERANEMHKMKENEESLALAYLYPALKSMVQRVLEDEDFTKRTY